MENDKIRIDLLGAEYDPKKSRFSVNDYQDALISGGRMVTPLIGNVRLMDKATNQPLEEKSVILANVPYMNDDGMFVHNGVSYAVSNQTRLKSGIYARQKDNGELESHFNVKSGTGTGMRLFMEPDTGIYRVSVDKSNIKLYPILKQLGVSDEALEQAWGGQVLKANQEAYDRKAFSKFYDKLLRNKANPEATDEEKLQQIKDNLAKTELDPEVNTRTLGKPHSSITTDALIDSSAKLLRIARGQDKPDDRDHSANRTVHTVDDFLSDRVTKDAGNLGRTLLYRATYDRSLKALRPGYFTPQLEGLIVSNQLSAPISGINPFEVYDQQRRVIQLGEGAVSSQDSIPASSRNVQPSQLGLIDPIRSAESRAIGIDQRFAIGAMKGDDNQIYFPLRNRKTGKMEYLNSTQLHGKSVAFPKTPRLDAFRTPSPAALALGQALGEPQAADLISMERATQPDVKLASAVEQLLQAKGYSDQKNYPQKTRIVREMIAANPADWIVDSEKDGIVGLTHTPTSFKLHLPRQNVPDVLFQEKTAAELLEYVWEGKVAADGALPVQSPGNNLIPVLRGSKVTMADPAEAEYELPSAGHMFTESVNLAPMVSSMKGARTFIAAKYFNQALPLNSPQSPLVDTYDEETKDGYSKTIGHRVGVRKADVDGVVKAVDNKFIDITGPDGKDRRVDLKYLFPHNRKTFTTETPLVKPGDKVKAGQMIAKSNYVDDEGRLAMGTNLHVGFMPSPNGAGFEDAIAVSKRAANALASQHLYGFDVDHKLGVQSNKQKFLSLFPNKYTNEQLEKIDENGMAKPGAKINPGDPLFLSYAPRTLSSKDAALGNLHKVLKNSFQDMSQTWEKATPGEVAHAYKGRSRMAVNVSTVVPLQVGDKMCLSTDHEVLTRNGWIPISSISLNDEVCSLNPVTFEIEYQKPEAIHTYPHEGKMYEVNTTQVSMCVTGNHKLFADKRFGSKGKYTGNYRLIEADLLAGKKYKLKRDGKWVSGKSPERFVLPGVKYKNGSKGMRTSPGFECSIAQYMALLGMFLSEGNVQQRGQSGTYAVKITQTKKANRSECREFLKSLGVNFSELPDHFLIFNKALFEHFAQFGKSWQKYIPRHVFSYKKKHLKILLKYLHWGDGSVTEKTMLYFTCSPQLANDVQELSFLCGHAASLQHQISGDIVRGRKICAKRCRYIVHTSRKKLLPEINHGNKKTQNEQKEGWVDYSGTVHCITLSRHHVFYVRRKGKCHWTGNSARSGAKGVVSEIIDDDKMPRTKDDHLDVLINPAALIGRVNPAMVLEALLGKIAHKHGKRYAIPSFSEDSFKEYVKNELAAHNESDTEDVFNPETGRSIPKIMVGRQFFQKLEHMSADKISGRGEEGVDSNDQPTKGGFSGAKRLGGLQSLALLSYGATNVLRDVKLMRGSSNSEMWRKIRMGEPLPAPKVPFIYNKFLNSLRASGINIKEDGNKTHMLALTDKEIAQMARHEIQNADTIDPKSGEPIKGGLMDMGIHGTDGQSWSYIQLDHPIPNPVMEDPIRRLLGMTEKEMRETIATKPDALKEQLSKLNLDEMEEDAKNTIRLGRKTKRDDAVRKLNFITGLKAANIKPEEMMISRIPVIPPTYRPVTAIGKLMLTSDANYLYRDLMTARDSYRSNKSDLPDEELGDQRLSVYDAAKAVTGLGDPINVETQEKGVKGFVRSIAGVGGPKTGLFQSKVLSHPVNAVGRGVATPDSDLNMDEVGVPEKMAWEIFSPFTMRRMVKAGMPASEAAKQIENQTEFAKKFMLEEMDERPVMYSRDPALHRFSILGGKAILKPGDGIRTSPLIVKGMNLDYDGDQINVHVPVSPEAVRDVKEKMFPSKNLLSIKDRTVFQLPQQEFILGLAKATGLGGPKTAPIRFPNAAAAMAAYKNGDISIDQPIEIG